ncbi:hypothetical protein KDA11_05500 [Candidatus Saccharibacteria bacterium]|nr:hypothetical protein [Candidatus Saccharibacteria bacterium]MCA9348430.1 hypothetical protein [Candidatus Saccharibacteria bacterium]
MSKTKKIVLVVIGVLLLLIVGGGLSAYLSTSKERKLASTFVSDLASGNNSSAYAQFSSALQQAQDEATFNSQVATLQLDSSCRLQISGMETSSSTDTGTVKTVTGSVKCSSKTLTNAKFVYDGNQKLNGYQINP